MRIRGGRVRRGRIGMRRGASTGPTLIIPGFNRMVAYRRLLPGPVRDSFRVPPPTEGTLARRRAYDHVPQEVAYGSPHHSAVAVVQASGAVGGSESLTRPGG